MTSRGENVVKTKKQLFLNILKLYLITEIKYLKNIMNLIQSNQNQMRIKKNMKKDIYKIFKRLMLVTN